LAILCIGYFGLSIVRAVAGGALPITLNSPFSVQEPGAYILWISEASSDSSETFDARRFKVLNVTNKELTVGAPFVGQLPQRSQDSRTFVGVCEFQLSAAGWYRLLSPPQYRGRDLLINKDIMSRAFVVSLLAAFAFSFVLFLLAFFFVWANMQWGQPALGTGAAGQPALFSAAAGLQVFGGGYGAKASWPLAHITLDADSLTLAMPMKTFVLRLDEIDSIRFGWIYIHVAHHAPDVPAGVWISGFGWSGLAAGLRRTILQNGLPIRFSEGPGII
jgi:hypothetical protein